MIIPGKELNTLIDLFQMSVHLFPHWWMDLPFVNGEANQVTLINGSTLCEWMLPSSQASYIIYKLDWVHIWAFIVAVF